ncbi:MAG: hypothetical protein E7222_05555 [Clostridiales bacterium]|nr:hypothetical protein [Clostridiales bacterium]
MVIKKNGAKIDLKKDGFLLLNNRQNIRDMRIVIREILRVKNLNRLLKTITDIPEDGLSDFNLISNEIKGKRLYFKKNIFDNNDIKWMKKFDKDPNCEVSFYGFEYFKEKTPDYITIENQYDLLTGKMKDKKVGWYLVSSKESFIELWELSALDYCYRVLETGKGIDDYTLEIQSYEHLLNETDEGNVYGGHAIQIFEKI